ncbi:hypothetical protein L3Y34_013728 [Caenorhabditis briggsae]|uniref:Uncharacterized protein n=1 Tax=Caenorhabditis briggsae TaxID=6238 RepID=A0AAE8ZVV9_CAEBR|nr:hypothetical protein L3Y34_013728 [Caenorhabditis briggsae]
MRSIYHNIEPHESTKSIPIEVPLQSLTNRTLCGDGVPICNYYNENNHISTMSMKRSQRVPCSISRIHFVHCFSLEPMLHKLLL